MSQKRNPQDQYLKYIGRTWYVSIRVPRTLEKIVGNTHVRRSLQTNDKRTANLRKHALVAQIKGELERLRQAPEERQKGPALTFADAKAYRAEIIQAEAKADYEGADALALEAVTTAEEVERLYGTDNAKRWYRAATRTSDTLRELMDKWLKVSDYRESTNLGHRKALSELLAFLKDEDAHPEDVDRKRAVQYIEADLFARGLAHHTIRDKLNSLVTFWDWIASRGVITAENPWTRHKISKTAHKGRSPAKRAYTDEELIKLLKGTERARAWPTWSYLPDLMVLGLYTGCRAEELCSLSVEQVEKVRGGLVLHIKDAKTQAGVRPVAVVNAAVVDVVKQRTEAAKAHDEHRLFPELTRGGADEKFSFAAVKAFGRYRRECGIPDGTDLHSLRRCVATVLENSGVSQVDIARFMGHKIGTMAGDVYSYGGSKVRAVDTARRIKYSKAVEAAASRLVL